MIDNPVLRKELLLRSRIRQTAPVRIGVIVASTVLLIWIYYSTFRALLFDASASSAHSIWALVVWVQFLLICIVAPATTANAIAQEKEQQTWEMLIFTRLRPAEIIFGKLISRMAVLVILILLSVPITLMCMLRASGTGDDAITPALQLGTYAVMFLTSLFFATFGLFMSWLLNRTLYALITSYTVLFGGLVMVTYFITFILTTIVSDPNFFYKCPIVWLNPIQLFFETTVTNSAFPQAPIFVMFGLFGYVLLTALLLWRMIAGFRQYSYQ